MRPGVTGILLVALVGHSYALFGGSKEVCCPRIGCIDNESGPMSHLPNPSCPDDFKLTFLLMTRQNKEVKNGRVITASSIPSVFDPTKLTIFTSHGWMGEADMDWMRELVEGLLNKVDANVIVADWPKMSKKVYYPTAAANTQTVGAELAYLMKQLNQHQHVSYDDMWCIGFSLGAHVCGHAGMKTGGKLGRATGLDPAGPSFHKRDILNGINPTSAKFVDIVHADGAGIISYYGLMERRGHIDFYPNGGRDQPGCYFGRRKRDARQIRSEVDCIDFDGWIDPDNCPYNMFIGCSHYRGVYYFLDTVLETDCHVSTLKCNDHHNLPASCQPTTATQMGFYADKNHHKSGVFFLETAKKRPYCK